MQPVSSFLRTAILIHEDVDIYDVKKIAWAVGNRMVDFFAIEEDKPKRYELRIGMDATKPIEALLDKYKRTKTKTVNL